MVNWRRLIFWIHLSLGMVAGLMGALMAGTGVIMAFADSYIDLRDRPAQHIDPPDAARPKSIAELAALANAAHPESAVNRVGIARDSHRAYEFHADPQKLDYVNPFSGAIHPSDSVPLRRTLHKDVEQWHRFLGLAGDRKAVGKFIASWMNVALIPLLLTGLIVWWPASLRWQAVRAGLTPLVNGRGTHRSWHAALGFWTMPFLLIMVVTATTHSFAWVRDSAIRMAGSTSPKAGSHDSLWAPTLPKRTAPAGVRPLSFDQLREIADREIPGWERLEIDVAPQIEAGKPAKAASLVARAPGWGPAFFPVAVQVDPFTGEVLDIHSWADLSGGTRLLAWARWLHKGEAFGRTGQIIAGLACLVMLALIGTGWTLAIRRGLRSRRR